MQRFETGIRTVIAFNEAFNRHDVGAMGQLMSDDCVYEAPGPAPDGTLYSGKPAIIQFCQDLFDQCPMVHSHIEDIFSAGERCIMVYKCSWVAASGVEVHVRRVDIFRVQGGLICEQLSFTKGEMPGSSDTPKP
jgi:ketosteroid isomerase-like protein